MFRRLLRTDTLAICLPIAAAIVLYAQTIGFGYVRWDDPQLITENPLVRSLSPRIFWSYDPELFIPATLLTYQIEMALSGGAAWMAHGTNILLHACNGALLFMLLRRLTRDPWAASMGAALFIVHPLCVEAVAWASGRKELLWALWSLATVLLLSSGKHRWSLACMILAACSKPTAVVTPLLARAVGTPWKQLRGVGIVAVLTLAVAIGGKAHTIGILTIGQMLALAAQSIAGMLLRIVWPATLSPVYAVALPVTIGSALLPACALTVLAGCIWLLRRNHPLLWTGALWFAAALLPSLPTYLRSNEVQLAADRYGYMPLVGIAIIAAGTVATCRPRPKICAAIVTVLALALSATTFVQTRFWRSSSELFAMATQRNPLSAVAWNNRADGALDTGNLTLAEEAASRALTLRPEYADALANMGAVRGRQERFNEAEQFLTQALALKPDHLQATFNLAGVLWKRGELEKALVAYHRVLELRPGFAPALAQIERIERQLHP